jgi:hypothetical protein
MTRTSGCGGLAGPQQAEHQARPPRVDGAGSDAGQGVGAAPWAGAELVPAERVGVAEDRGTPDEDDDEGDDDSDDEVVADEEEDSEPSAPVAGAVGWDGELSAGVVAGAVVVGDGGVDGVVSRCEDALASSPMVVVPDEWELPTSADTGFCPMSSIPVTMPMATTKTATA